ncbi:hypothetical protein [Streptomyces sp. B6B3]|uniref:hypothetical protein n=1 Tax=Streptomyces sp. B6B3 TaxID=3153570 RepID=UPI00325F21E1
MVRLDNRRLRGLARRQQQVLTASQLTALDVPNSTLWRRCSPGGPWQNPYPRVVVLHNGPLSVAQRYWAALLYAAGRDDPASGRWPGALITGTAALALHRLHAAPSPEDVREIDVLVPAHRNVPSRGSVRVLRTRRLPHPPRWIDPRLPTAPPARAVADAVRRGAPEAEGALYEVVQNGRVAPEAMAAELRAERLTGRAWVRDAVADLRVGVRSPAEARARRLIDGAEGLPTPVWNARLLLDGEWLADPDAYWPRHGVLFEVDSLRYHLGLAEHQRTMARRNRITRTGLMVLAATPAMVRDQPEEVLNDLRGLLTGGPYGPWQRVELGQP